MATKNEGRQVAGQKSSMGGRGDPKKASPAAVERYLRGIQLPASKQDLLQQAKQNGAPGDVLYVLKHFNDRYYNTVWEIARETGVVDQKGGSDEGSPAEDEDEEEDDDEAEGDEEGCV